MVDSLHERVREMLLMLSTDDLDEDSMNAALAKLLSLGDWPSVRSALLGTLQFGSTELWPETVQVVYLLQNRGHVFEPAFTIALLYDGLERHPGLDGNLVWTITRNLMGEGYCSDYDPYKDTEVTAEMDKILRERTLRNGSSP